MYQKYYKLPSRIHFWEVDGYIRLSANIRNELQKLIKNYGVRKLSRTLKFDRETIYSIYSSPKNKRAHSISCLIKIAIFLNLELISLEKDYSLRGKAGKYVSNSISIFFRTIIFKSSYNTWRRNFFY